MLSDLPIEESGRTRRTCIAAVGIPTPVLVDYQYLDSLLRGKSGVVRNEDDGKRKEMMALFRREDILEIDDALGPRERSISL